MRHVTRKWSAIGAVASVVLFAPGAAVHTQPAPTRPADLASLFTPGSVLQDRNGDGFVDFINARIVLAEKPSAADVSAAADVAARFGFETMAMNLPMPVTSSASGSGAAASGATAFVIGADGVRRIGSTVSTSMLRPGEGIVSVTTAGDGPAVIVAGADAAGTMAAAELLAGRLPRVWDPKGATLTQVTEDVKAVLTAGGVTVTDVSIPRVTVRAGDTEIRSIDIGVGAQNSVDAAKAVAALRRLTQTPVATTKSPRPLSYAGAASIRVEVSAAGAKSTIVELPRTAAPPRGPEPPRPGSEAKEKLTLANLYTADGLLGDSDSNRIPDRLDVILSPFGEGTEGTVNLAARLGLESTGISIPIALPPDRLTAPDEQPTLVLIGLKHPLVDKLITDKKFAPPVLQPGEGLLHVVRKAFGEKSAVIVTGADERGLSRALAEAAERLPHVWARGKDRTTLDDIQDEVRRTLSGRTPAGQAATALYKLDALVRDLGAKNLESADVIVSLEKPVDRFADVVRQHAAKLKAERVNVVIDNRDVQHAKTIIDDSFDIPSEVDEFWQQFRTKLLPLVKKNQPVTVEARLSEPPEMRAQIEKDARAELVKAGAGEAGTSVSILCAYKQGYSWLYDVVRPAIAGKPVESITIRFARIGPPPEWKQQAMYSPTRWLLEAYPIADVLARELKIDRAEDQVRGGANRRGDVRGHGQRFGRRRPVPRHVRTTHRPAELLRPVPHVREGACRDRLAQSHRRRPNAPGSAD